MLGDRHVQNQNPNKIGFSFTSAIDSAFRYLRNIRRRPISIQILIGASTGCATGFLFTKTSRIAAIIAGCSIILLQFFNYRGYLKFNRTQIQRDFDQLKDSLRSDFGMEKPIVPTTKEIDDFLTKNGYLFAGFIAGSLIGYGLA